MTVLAKIEPEWCYDNADRCAMQAKIDEENRDHLRHNSCNGSCWRSASTINSASRAG